LAAQLTGLRGRFLLSLNDVPEVRRIFRGFKVQRVSTTYTRIEGKGKKVSELIISG
jgi:DNA adenine methylase